MIIKEDALESGDFSKWDQIRVSPDTATVEIVTVNPLKGKYSAKCYIPGLATGAQIAALQWLNNWTTLYARALVRVDVFQPVEETDRINPIVFLRADGLGLASIAIEMHGGVPTWTLRCGGRAPAYMTTPFELGKTYCIEASYNAGGPIEMWIDGEHQPLSHTNPNVDPVAAVRFGIGSSANLQNPATIVVDACAIGDSYIGSPPVTPHQVTLDSLPIGVAYMLPSGVAPFSVNVQDGESLSVQVPPEIEV